MIEDAGFRAIFEHALDPMLVADDQANYVDANPAACALFRLSREEICTHRVVDFAPAEGRAVFDAVWQSFLEAGDQQGEYILQLADGATRWVEFSATANVLSTRDSTCRSSATSASASAWKPNARSSSPRSRRWPSPTR